MQQLHTGTVATGHGTYGFGWKNSTLDGVGTRIVWHAGATPDFFTHIVLAPDSNLAVIIMTNVYGLHMDAPLSAGAFNLARILHGGSPATATEDPMQVWALAGLLGVAAVLLTLLVWSWARVLRRRRVDRVPPARSRGRTIAATVAWVGACAAVAVLRRLAGAGLLGGRRAGQTPVVGTGRRSRYSRRGRPGGRTRADPAGPGCARHATPPARRPARGTSADATTTPSPPPDVGRALSDR